MKRLLPFVMLTLGLIILVPLVTITLDRGPWGRSPVGNESAYWEAAKQPAAEPAPESPTRRSPNPLFTTLLATVVDEGASAVPTRRVLSFVFLPLLAVLGVMLAWGRVRPWVAVVVGLVTVTTAPLVLSAGTFTPALPGAVLGILALVAVDKHPRHWRWLVAGSLAGLAAIFQSEIGWALFLGLVLLGAVRPGRVTRFQAVGAFVTTWLIVTAGISLTTGADSLFPRPDGIDAFRGHRLQASGVSPRRGDDDAVRWWTRVDFFRRASQDAGQKLTLEECTAYWRKRAFTEAAKHPIAETKRNRVKLLASFQGDPLPREISPAFLAEQTDSPTLPFTIWMGRILLPLGLAGLVLGRKKTGGVLWVGALSGVIAAILTYAQADYRPITVLCLLVGFGLFIELMVLGPAGARLKAGIGGVIALMIFGFWPVLGGVPGLGVSGDDHYFLGVLHDRDGRGSAAMREYERSRGLEPDSPYPGFAIAGMLARDNVLEQATNELERLRELNPGFIAGLIPLTKLYERQERWSEAAAVYGDLIRMESWNPEYLNNLATMYVQIGFYDQAIRALESALEVDPHYETAQVNLRSLQERGIAPGGAPTDSLAVAQNEIVEAIRIADAARADSLLADAYRNFGRKPELIYLEGTLRLASGDFEEAIRLLESIRSVMSHSVIYLNNLAASYAQAGRLREAKAVWEEALKIQPQNERIRLSLESIDAVLDSIDAAP